MVLRFEPLISKTGLENGNNAADVSNKFRKSGADLRKRKQRTWARFDPSVRNLCLLQE